jgi:hypothetical protein
MDDDSYGANINAIMSSRDIISTWPEGESISVYVPAKHMINRTLSGKIPEAFNRAVRDLRRESLRHNETFEKVYYLGCAFALRPFKG